MNTTIDPKELYPNLVTIRKRLVEIRGIAEQNYDNIYKIGHLHPYTSTEDEALQFPNPNTIMEQIDTQLSQLQNTLQTNNNRLNQLTQWLKDEPTP